MVDATDPHRCLGELACPVADREDDGDTAVGDVRRRDVGYVAEAAAVLHRLRLQPGEAARVRPQRCDVVGIELQRERPVELAPRWPGERVDERGVDALLL